MSRNVSGQTGKGAEPCSMKIALAERGGEVTVCLSRRLISTHTHIHTHTLGINTAVTAVEYCFPFIRKQFLIKAQFVSVCFPKRKSYHK